MADVAIQPIVESVPFKIKDIGLSDAGRKAIDIAEKEMPGLMATREKYGPQKTTVREKSYRIPAHDCGNCSSY